jgi:hypothetical protein
MEQGIIPWMERKREGERDNRRCPELFFKGMTGALGPFSYLV